MLRPKAAPLVATITVVDIHAVANRVRQDTFVVFEPLILQAVICMIITGIIVLICRWLENRVHARSACGRQAVMRPLRPPLRGRSRPRRGGGIGRNQPP